METTCGGSGMSENKNAKTPADGPAANRAMTLEEVQQWITTTWLRCQDEVWRQLPTKHMSRETMKQEPMAWQCQCGKAYTVTCISSKPPKQWVGLTDDEINILSCEMVKGDKSVNWLCKVLEAKLREKNHG